MELTDLFKVWQGGGNFVSGVILGCFVSHLSQKIASSERNERHKIELEREKMLLQQLDTKEKRIDELHSRLQGAKPRGSIGEPVKQNER